MTARMVNAGRQRAQSNPQEVERVLAALGIDTQIVGPDTIQAAGHQLTIANAAHPTPTEAAEIGTTADLVVADRLSQAARSRLDETGTAWLDRRGHLKIRLPGLIIDTDVARLLPPEHRRSGALGQTGLDIAVTLLVEPGRSWGVNELARQLDRSPGRVSEVLHSLREQGLVTPATTPLVPELFWAAADQWKPRWMPLSAMPDEPDLVRLSGGRAAAALGAGLVLSADWPLELYIADAWELRHLATNPSADQGRVVGASCPSAAALRLQPAGRHGDLPLANPIVIALDLAQDRARGREVLEAWNPPGYTRVW